jgi:hypothetical protein
MEFLSGWGRGKTTPEIDLKLSPKKEKKLKNSSKLL